MEAPRGVLGGGGCSYPGVLVHADVDLFLRRGLDKHLVPLTGRVAAQVKEEHRTGETGEGLLASSTRRRLLYSLLKVDVFDHRGVGIVHPDAPDVSGGQNKVHQSLLRTDSCDRTDG